MLRNAAGGTITDNELNQWLVNPLPAGARLHAILDACHSGTALDLEFMCVSRGLYIQYLLP